MEFVVWGAGRKGTFLYRGIGDSIIAYIDSDLEKIGKNCCGVPIISLEKYKESYRDKIILILLFSYHGVVDILESENIYNYLLSEEMPTRLQGFGNEDFWSLVLQKSFVDKNIYLYGLSGYSLLLKEELEKRGHQTYIIPQEGLASIVVEDIRKTVDGIICYEEIKKEEVSKIYIVIGEDEKVINRLFLDIKKEDIFESTEFYITDAYRKLGKLHNYFSSRKRCFIVATGPSLRYEDLLMLKANKEFCISMNEIIDCDENWKPDVYVATDTGFLEENIDSIINYEADIKILNDIETLDELYATDNRIYRCHLSRTGTHGIRFSEDIEKTIYQGVPLVYICLQIAVYLGFKEIYLLGTDCDYSSDKGTHFNGNVNTTNRESRVEDMILAYKVAREYACSHGIKIYNATRGGKLEVFDRIEFDSLF